MTDATLRAEVTIGLQGAVIANPADFDAPEIDMEASTLDVVIK